jgi:hypothetical protein
MTMVFFIHKFLPAAGFEACFLLQTEILLKLYNQKLFLQYVVFLPAASLFFGGVISCARRGLLAALVVGVCGNTPASRYNLSHDASTARSVRVPPHIRVHSSLSRYWHRFSGVLNCQLLGHRQGYR